MTKRLTDEELEELARRVRPGYVELFPHELASLLAEVRELRAYKASVDGYRERLCEVIGESRKDLANRRAPLDALMSWAARGEFDAAIFGAPAEGGAL